MVKKVGSKNKDKKKKGGFKYKPRTVDSIKNRADQSGSRFDSPFQGSVDVWRPKVGDNTIRVLPPIDGNDGWDYEIWVHKNVGPNNSTYLCPNKMKGKPCPICNAAKAAQDAGEQDEAAALIPKKNYVAWIIDRDDDTPTPQLYMFGWQLDRDINSLCINKRSGKILQIDNPEEGYGATGDW